MADGSSVTDNSTSDAEVFYDSKNLTISVCRLPYILRAYNFFIYGVTIAY